MKQINLLSSATLLVTVAFFFFSCNEPADKTTAATNDSTATTEAKPDNQSLKAEIQALETAWANADNAGDATTIASFYADDAVSLSNNMPMATGKAAIKKEMDEGFAKRKTKGTVFYDVLDVYGCDNYATEVGKTTRKDSTGTVMRTGKYMAVWEKRDGKWLCIRDISNDDEKRKD